VGFTTSDFIIDEFDTISYKNQVEIWDRCIARIRKNSGLPTTGSIVTSPATSYRYTHDLFVKGLNGKPPTNTKLIQASTRDNKFNPSDFVSTLESQYDSELQKAYIDGKFMNINKLAAYYAFSQLNILRENYVPKKLQILVGMDFNVSPLCATVGELQSDGSLVIFKELILDNANTEMMANKIKSLYPKADITIYPDLTSLTKRATNAPLGVSDITILAGEPFKYKIAGTRISTQKDRMNTVNGAMAHNKVKIDKNCKELISDFYKTERTSDGKIDKSRETKHKPYGHLTDAAGYLIQRLFPLTVRTSGVVRSA